MNLYLKLAGIGGAVTGDPVTELTLSQLVPEFDGTTVPAGYVKFVKSTLPELKKYEILEGPFFTVVDGVYHEFWTTRLLDGSDKEDKIQDIKQQIKDLETESVRSGKAIIITGHVEITDEAINLQLTSLLNQLNNLL